MWRSDDGGHAWRIVSWDRRLIGRAGYYINVEVNPANPDEVYVMNSSSHKSVDGMMDVELQLLSRTDIHSDDKWYVESYKVYMQLIWLNAEVGLGAGDVQGGAEYRPTDAAVEWFRTVEAELAAASADFERIVETELPALNQAMAGRIPAITDVMHP